MSAPDEQLAAWLAPIRADAPAGRDARDEPAHEQIRAEIEKLGRADARQVNWESIAVHADVLLRTHTKDLLVASCLARALASTRGVVGLEQGMQLLAGLLTEHGHALFPLRPRARSAALAWYVQQTEAVLCTLSADRKVAGGALSASLSALQVAAERVLGADAPSWLRLTRGLAPAAPAAAEPAGGEEAGSSVRPAPELRARGVPHAPANDAAAAPRALRQAASNEEPAALLARGKHLLLQVARARFDADLADPYGYRLRRLAAGLGIDSVPLVSKRGRSELDPPSARLCAALHASLCSEAWEDALRASEPLIEHCPLWLEGHFLGARALTALGARFAPALAVVEQEARALWTRLPGLEGLCFADGTPLASGEALSWLRARPEVTPAVSPSAATASTIDVALLTRVARGEPGACGTFEQQRRGAPSACAEFDLRRALAEALEGAGKPALASALYRGLARDAATFRLARWDPERAASVYAGLRRTLAPSDGAMHAAEASLARLAPTALL